MDKRIIYQNSDGGLSIIIPSGEIAIEEVARKDVPAGVPYKIVDAADIPTDRTFRNAWEADMTDAHGQGVGAQAWFIKKYRAEIDAINAEQRPAQPEVLEPVSFEEIKFPEEATEEEKQASYAAYCEQVQEENNQRAAAYLEAVAQWEVSKSQRINELNKKIAVQEQELAA